MTGLHARVTHLVQLPRPESNDTTVIYTRTEQMQ
jgi:hypothetical protein